MAVWELVELLLFAHFARPGPLGFSGHCYTTPSLFPYNGSWLSCVFMFRPAILIRTFWFIESVLSTSWVLVSTQRFSQKRDTITGQYKKKSWLLVVFPLLLSYPLTGQAV